MKKQNIFLLIIIITFPLWYKYFHWFALWITNNDDKLRRDITLIASAISIILYVKVKFFDSKLFNKIVKTYGKDKLIQSLTVIAKMLNVLSPEEVMSRISAISETQYEMKHSIKIINDIITTGNSTKKIEINLTKEEKKQLKKQIKYLMEVIDKELEIHNIIQPTNLADQMKKSIKHKDNIISNYENPKREKAKNDLLRLNP